MANKRLSKERQTLVLMALCEGMPIRAAARMFKVGKNTIHRLICETGEAFAHYMDQNFRDLPCIRIEMDELLESKMNRTQHPQIFDDQTDDRSCRQRCHSVPRPR